MYHQIINKWALQIIECCRLGEKHLYGRKRSGKEFREILFCCLETALEMEDNFKWPFGRTHRMLKLENIEAINHLPIFSVYTEETETQRDQLMDDKLHSYSIYWVPTACKAQHGLHFFERAGKVRLIFKGHLVFRKTLTCAKHPQGQGCDGKVVRPHGSYKLGYWFFQSPIRREELNINHRLLLLCE